METRSALPKVRSTLSQGTRKPNLMKMMQDKIRANPKSRRKFASEANVTYGTLQTVLKIDLNLSPFKKNKAQVLSQTVKVKRLNRAKILFKKFKDGRQPPVLWTDERLLTVQAMHNHQNDSMYAVNKEDIPLNERIANKCQKSASVMVWEGVASTGGKTPPIIIERG